MISSWQASIVNDVAIARLYKPLQAEGTKPICLASSEITADLVGAGWGMKDCYQDSQETLRRAKVCNYYFLIRLQNNKKKSAVLMEIF